MSHVRSVRIHLGMPDASGRQTPQEIANSHVNIEADLVLKALGFDPEDLPALLDAPDLGVTGWGTLKIDWQQHDDQPRRRVRRRRHRARRLAGGVGGARRPRRRRAHPFAISTTRAQAALADRRGVTTMLTLYDFMGSGNGYKVRLLLAQLGMPYKLDRARHPEGRDAHAGIPGEEPQRPHPDAAARGRHAPRRVGRHPLVPGRGHDARAGRPAGARRRRCNGCSSSSTATSPTSRRCASGSTSSPKLTPLQEMELPGRMEKGYAALGVMEQHLARHHYFVGEPLRSRRHRALCLHPRRAARAGSTSTTIRRSTPGWRASPASPATSSIDHKKLKGRAAMPMINVQMFEGRTHRAAPQARQGTHRGHLPRARLHARRRADHPDRHQEGELGRGREAVFRLATRPSRRSPDSCLPVMTGRMKTCLPRCGGGERPEGKDLRHVRI